MYQMVWAVDISISETILTDLSKLSDIVKNDVVKKTEYVEWLKKSMPLRLPILMI